MQGEVTVRRWSPELMARKDGKDATVWLRAIRWHTYEGKSQNEGDCYLAHEDMIETIVDVLKFAVRDVPPPRAERLAPPVAAPAASPDPPAAKSPPPMKRRVTPTKPA